MSSDLVIRVVVVAAVAAAALGVARGWPRWRARRIEQAPLSLGGLHGNVLFFSSRSCASCERMRRLLAAENADPAEFVYEDHADAWGGWGVGAVPLVVVRDAGGAVLGTVAGSASRRRLRKALTLATSSAPSPRPAPK